MLKSLKLSKQSLAIYAVIGLVMCFTFIGRARALTGEATSIMPNQVDQWLVVALPGSNGMLGPYSKTIAYIKNTGAATYTIDILDACDNTTNDSSNNNTYKDTWFYVSNIEYMTGKNIYSNTYGGLRNPTAGNSATSWKMKCTGGTGLRVFVKPNNSTEIENINGVNHYKINILASVSYNPTGYNSFYENRYKVQVFDSNYVAYAKDNGVSSSDVSSNYTGVGYKSGSSGFSWSTKIGFASKCSQNSQGNVVNFYDTDYLKGSTLPSGVWQNDVAGQKMYYEINSYDRKNKSESSKALVISGYLTGIGNVKDNTLPFDMSSDRVYVIEIKYINKVNTIQVQLPYDQIYINDDCNTAPTGKINASCSNGTVTLISVSITDAEGGAMSIKATGATGSSTQPNANGSGNVAAGNSVINFTSPGNTFLSPMDAVEKTVSGSLTDGKFTVAISGKYTCFSPANAITCSFTNMIIEEGSGTLNPYKLSYQVNKNSNSSVSVYPRTKIVGKYTDYNEPALVLSSNTINALSSKLVYLNTSNDVKDWAVSVSIFSDSTRTSLLYTCDGTLSIVRKPFFKVSNGDLMAGASFLSSAEGCSSSSTGNVYSWAKDDATAGANTEYVASIFGTALGFYSGKALGPPASSKKYLTISNSDGAATWGGNSGLSNCLKDTYADTIRVSATNQSQYTGDITIGATSVNDKRVVYVIDGNVRITGNITLSPGNNSFFALIVKGGNIYIDNDVDEIQGVYIAQPDGENTGNIYTCTITSAPIASSDIYSNCGKKLTIRGIVQANTLKLHRVNGTLGNNTAAEEFIGLPQLYFVKNTPLTNTTGSKEFDSITNLPPIL